MKLTLEGLNDTSAWENAGVKLPGFDIDDIKKNTYDRPFWIHFGAGNIFRAFQARCVQNLLNSGDLDAGLVCAEGFDYQIIDKINYPYDNLSLVATLKGSGDIDLISKKIQQNRLSYRINRLSDLSCGARLWL